MLTVFLDLVGFGIILPLLPSYASDMGGTADTVGVLLASSLLERIGSSMVVALGGGALGAVGLLFARALSRRQAKLAAG